MWKGLIEYVDGYTRMGKKCKFICTVCWNIWKATPSNILQKHGCHECAKTLKSEIFTMPLAVFITKLKEIYGNLISYISVYVNTHIKCKFRCNTCGYEWETKPTILLNERNGCPICKKESLEKPIMDALLKKELNLFIIQGWMDVIIMIVNFHFVQILE